MSGKSSKSPSCPCFFAFAASYSPTYSRVCENRWQIKFACGQAAHCTRIIQRILTTGTPTSPLSSISAPWLSTPPTIAVHSFPGYFCLCSSVPCTITSRASMGRRFAIPQIEYWFLIWWLLCVCDANPHSNPKSNVLMQTRKPNWVKSKLAPDKCSG
jgi:hypothetical protein